MTVFLPELYGMKQLGLYSNFFMNLTDPFSLRQNNERSPEDRTLMLKYENIQVMQYYIQ